MEVKILGAEEVKQRLDDMKEAVKDAYVVVGTDVVYAPGIEFGRHPGGRLARKLGGSFALTDAFEAVKPKIEPKIRWELAAIWANKTLGSSGGAKRLLAVMVSLGNEVRTRTSELLRERVYSVSIPMTRRGKSRWTRTGTLRRSYHVEAFGQSIGRGGTGNLRAMYRVASKVE